MRRYGGHYSVEMTAAVMRLAANRAACYDGLGTPENEALLRSLTGVHAPTGSLLIFSRDAGMHSGGWWKNPDYERCWHLSLSFGKQGAGNLPKDAKLTERWLYAFYYDNRRYVWAEPPYTAEGRERDVWHYRVFCDPGWQPIIPRGEVYSREFTERGWLSYSDLQSAHAARLRQLEPMPGEQ
jgi:hypothetical protein